MTDNRALDFSSFVKFCQLVCITIFCLAIQPAFAISEYCSINRCLSTCNYNLSVSGFDGGRVYLAFLEERAPQMNLLSRVSGYCRLRCEQFVAGPCANVRPGGYPVPLWIDLTNPNRRVALQNRTQSSGPIFAIRRTRADVRHYLAVEEPVRIQQCRRHPLIARLQSTSGGRAVCFNPIERERLLHGLPLISQDLLRAHRDYVTALYTSAPNPQSDSRPFRPTTTSSYEQRVAEVFQMIRGLQTSDLPRIVGHLSRSQMRALLGRYVDVAVVLPRTSIEQLAVSHPNSGEQRLDRFDRSGGLEGEPGVCRGQCEEIQNRLTMQSFTVVGRVDPSIRLNSIWGLFIASFNRWAALAYEHPFRLQRQNEFLFSAQQLRNRLHDYLNSVTFGIEALASHPQFDPAVHCPFWFQPWGLQRFNLCYGREEIQDQLVLLRNRLLGAIRRLDQTVFDRRSFL